MKNSRAVRYYKKHLLKYIKGEISLNNVNAYYVIERTSVVGCTVRTICSPTSLSFTDENKEKITIKENIVLEYSI